MKFRIPSVSEFTDGFEYEAYIGYEWVKCKFPKTGFTIDQIQLCIDDGIIRVNCCKIRNSSNEIQNND